MLTASVEHLEERFRQAPGSKDLFATLDYVQQVTDRLSLEFQAQRIERYDSPRDFEELRLLAAVRYSFRELREPASAVFNRAFERRTQLGRLSESRTGPAGEDEE